MTGPARLKFGQRAYVMGIINVTPDSFSGDGLLKEYDVTCLALSQARRFLAAGADILDIGGESTRPGAETISAQEEIERVVPVIQTLKEAQLDAIISVDTYKAEVAAAALAAGADWINDVWGLMADADLGRVAAASQAPLILMHNRSKPTDVRLQEKLGGRYENVVYQDLIADIRKDLTVSVELALAAVCCLKTSSSIRVSDSAKQCRRIWKSSAAWMKLRQWATRCCWGLRASLLSVTPSICRPISAWKVQ